MSLIAGCADCLVLKQDIKTLDGKIIKLQEEVSDLRDEVTGLRRKDKKITIREVARAMEWRICVRAAGSKTKAKAGLYNFDKINKSRQPGVIDALAAQLLALKLREDTLGFLKDLGDEVVHDARTMEAVEMRSILRSMETSEDEATQYDAVIEALGELKMIQDDGCIMASS
jgi:hypothetical protein